MVAAIALATAGCSMMQPYVTPEDPAKAAPVDGLVLAGQAEEALDSAQALRREYYANLATSAKVRNGTAVLATGLGGWAIYRGLKPANTGSGTASDGDKRGTLRLGVGLGVLYGLREFLVNPEQETANSQGYRAVTCMMLASRPLLMTKRKPRVPVPAIPYPLTEHDVLMGDAKDDGDLDKLQAALQKLDHAILQVNLKLAEDYARADDVAGGNEDVKRSQKPLRDQFVRTEKALRYARHALADGLVVTSAVESSGTAIRDELNRVAGSVNEQIRASERDLPDAATSIKNMRDFATTVLNIGASTATDQVADLPAPGTNAALASPQRPIWLAGPMSAAWGLLFGGGSSAGVLASATAEGGTTATKTKTLPKKTQAAASAASSPNISAADLKKIRDIIDKGIDAAITREQAAAKAAEAASAAKQLSALLELTKKINDGLQCPNSDPGQGACVRDLAKVTEILYAARRPVAQAVLNFRQLARLSTSAPECADQALIRVQPNEARVAFAGETLKYIVSQKVAGKNPIAVLDGPMNADTGVAFSFEAIPGGSAYTVTVTVGARMLRRDITLIVSDSTGVAALKLPIAAGGKPPLEAAEKASDAGSGVESPTKTASGAST